MLKSQFTHDVLSVSEATRQAMARKPACFIDNEWRDVVGSIPVRDPATRKVISHIADSTSAEVDAAVVAARAAFDGAEWRNMPPISREVLMGRLVSLIESNMEVLAELETLDNGMPLWFAQGGIMGAAGVYRYFSGWPSKLNGQTMPVEGPPGAGQFEAYTYSEPVGVIGAITPWNVPFMMAAWKLAPAIAAGCTVVLKPAEETSLTALKFAELVLDAGFPPGVINIVTGKGSVVGEALVQHPGVDKITFTGSTVVGRRIGELCGKSLKKHTLELGGKSPTLLFADADLQSAIPGVATSLFLNSGQICVAGSRLYVQDSIFEQVVEGLKSHIAEMSIGAGLNPDVFMGPLANAKQKEKVESYLQSAIESGCEVYRGAEVPDDIGYFVSPAIVVGAPHEHCITQEEIFGPVLSVYRFSEIDEVIKQANGTEYGLAAGIWSSNINTINRVSHQLNCGKVLINNAGFPYPGLSEGGRKASGHGRDLGAEGIQGFLQTKSVLVVLICTQN